MSEAIRGENHPLAIVLGEPTLDSDVEDFGFQVEPDNDGFEIESIVDILGSLAANYREVAPSADG